MITYQGTNADRWIFQARINGYEAGSNGLPLNPKFMHCIQYIEGYSAGIAEWLKKLEREEQMQAELNWIVNPY